MGHTDPNDNRRVLDAAALPEMQELFAEKYVDADPYIFIVFPAPAARPLPQLLSYPHSVPLG